MNLRIPGYQRPYKWTQQNVTELLNDISESIVAGNVSQYRVGTVILHQESDLYFIVDGQQRLLTFILICLALDPEFSCPLMLDDEFQKALAFDKVSQVNLHDNYRVVIEHIMSYSENDKEKLRQAICNKLEFVVVSVYKRIEAFQLFDSQNARGKRLYPHDLLKAYHLREIEDKYSMEHATVKWEAVDGVKIRDLFNFYLYPILSWSNGDKCGTFTEREINLFKGVSVNSRYKYAYGWRVVKAMPCYQLTEQFEAGTHFFGMVEHYLNMRHDVECEVCSWQDNGISKLLKIEGSTGFRYAKRLFFCALMCYYDRFANFNRRAITKLFQWAFMIRVDMENLGFDTINNYALGDVQKDYSNKISMFRQIRKARSHLEIADMKIEISKDKVHGNMNDERKQVYKVLSKLQVGR